MSGLNFIKPEPTLTHEDARSCRKRFDEENYEIVRDNTPVKAVFIGDSLTHNWNLHEYFSEYKGRVLNRGIGGDKSDLLLLRLEADCIQLKPELVVLGIGINNTWVLDDIDGSDEISQMSERIRNNILKDIKVIISSCVENSIKLILTSILPVNILPPTPGSATNAVRNKLIVSINKDIEKLAGEMGLIYADYHSALVSETEGGPCLKEGLAQDGIHVSKAAYDVMAEVLADAFRDYQLQIE